MNARKALVIVLIAGFVVLVLGIVLLAGLRFVRQEKGSQREREERLASVERYVNQITEERTGEPPEFLYSVRYRILKQPYPTASGMEAAIGKADSRSQTFDGTRLEWLGNPSSDPVLLRADFDSDLKLKKIEYHLKHEKIGRWPSDWQKEVEITIGTPQ
ncbi:MAG: hypothetical protein AABM67_20085 [Acidobacteriota bacterium]